MPKSARQVVEEFVFVIRASTSYTIGMGDLDPVSAMLAPLYNDLTSKAYRPQVLVTLPIFRLFSAKAQIGIMAHEFAHAERASRLGQGWHEKMQARHAAEERLANSIAIRWGFGKYVEAMRRERHGSVNPVLEARGPAIVHRALKQTRRQQEEFFRAHPELAPKAGKVEPEE
jgi:hypothetical protein